jgi:hypothetical protein
VSSGEAHTGRKRQGGSSRSIGVSWSKTHLQVRLTDKCRRCIGYFASEEDAARAYDCAAVQAHGPGAERNFPGEAISEPPVALGRKRQAPDPPT